MGIYCTTTSLATIMVDTSFDSATTALADKCVSWAETEVNKHLSKRYNIANYYTTTATIPTMLTTWTEWLSVGYIYQGLSRGGVDAFGRADKYIKMAMDNLKDVAAYKLDLIDNNGGVVSDFSNTAYRVLSTTDGYVETFAEDTPTSWSVDSDKGDDISSDRTS